MTAVGEVVRGAVGAWGEVDKEADALYLRLDESVIVESEEVSQGVILDYNESDEVVGVELLYLSKRSSDLDLYDL